jgi:hypothetical protein
MPPRRRRKVQKRDTSSPLSEDIETSVCKIGNAAVQRGLPALPPELLLHIISFLPEDITNDIVRANPPPHQLGPGFLSRSDTLLALSRVSTSLRQYFLPIAWRRLYACTATENGAWYKQVARRLTSHSSRLGKYTYLAAYVQ